MLKDILNLIRPYQYTKNLFIFLPAFFAFRLHEPEVLLNSLLAFIAFCFSASAVYVLNDWRDRHEDAQHPVKKFRPLASGAIKSQTALTLLFILVCCGIAFSIIVSYSVLLLILFYILLNTAYSFKLKHIPIIDVLVVSAGFVIRLFVGGNASGIPLVNWIIVMTFLLALFLALAKRRDDVLLYERTNFKARKVLDGYNLVFLDASIIMTGAIVIVAYIMWSVSPDIALKHNSQYIYLTSVFVISGILRYMQIAFVEEKCGSPTRILLCDRVIQCTVLGWAMSFILLFYVF